MDSQFSSLRRSAAGLLVLLAVAGSGPVAAGMFATEGAIANFTFIGGKVDYSTPSIGEMALVLSSENTVELSVRDAGGNTGVFDPQSGFTAKLNLNAKLNPDRSRFAGGDFMIFGSIPTAEESGQATLMEGTLDAMQEDDDDAGSLDFLFSGTRTGTTGTLAQQYQSIGIYAHVAGLEDIEWVRGYMDQPGSIIGTLGDPSMPEQGTPSPTAAIPAPATALLILAGLFGLGYGQRRNYR
jgi:hypothetical protein